MKKILPLLSALFLIIGTMSLTSCDKDDMIGLSLEGTWQGTMTTKLNFRSYSKSVYNSEIRFNSSINMNKGDGYWIDYFSSRGGDYYYYYITWMVKNETIYITFEDAGSQVAIYRYNLSGNYFSGCFDESDYETTRFQLTKTSDWDDYSTYHYGTGHGYGYYYDSSVYYDYSYSKSTRGSSNDSIFLDKDDMPQHEFIKK